MAIETTDGRTPLDVRMKRYEHVYRQYLPRRTYTLIRLDGRAFHTYLRGAEKPFDEQFMEQMDTIAEWLCTDIQGARFAYVQSDEISFLATDFETNQSEPWFGGNINKILSISAAQATGYMTALRSGSPGLPVFDSRVWTMSDPVEVANYFIWRQRDAVRNSIQMVGQSYFTQAQLHGKSGNEIQEMLFTEHGVNWDKFPDGCKRGRLVHCNELGWQAVGAPHFLAEPGTTLAQLIPALPSLHHTEPPREGS